MIVMLTSWLTSWSSSIKVDEVSVKYSLITSDFFWESRRLIRIVNHGNLTELRPLMIVMLTSWLTSWSSSIKVDEVSLKYSLITPDFF